MGEFYPFVSESKVTLSFSGFPVDFSSPSGYNTTDNDYASEKESDLWNATSISTKSPTADYTT